ncbi:hypothetical protein B0A50_02961 [Salinomyces thailandicus]|uniref:Uncharacterized protein n=1 Tax=Salinomyces thailandicus TaxID=706561 RepID=A0A4U0U1Q3_9PEZI|nr:hypothetical protein B0A50_02961 [Salinomyces thailandica]
MAALASSLDKLSISDSSKASPKQKRTDPAEFWEDEADTEPDSGTASPLQQVSSSDYPGAPPPTPASPSFSSSKTMEGSPYQTFPPYGMGGPLQDRHSGTGSSLAQRAAGGGEEKRPEKSTAVASRLIAAGIGRRPPRRTKEQREYDQAMRIQEKKKRDQAKAEEEKKVAERQKAKAAIWDD